MIRFSSSVTVATFQAALGTWCTRATILHDAALRYGCSRSPPETLTGILVHLWPGEVLKGPGADGTRTLRWMNEALKSIRVFFSPQWCKSVTVLSFFSSNSSRLTDEEIHRMSKPEGTIEIASFSKKLHQVQFTVCGVQTVGFDKCATLCVLHHSQDTEQFWHSLRSLKPPCYCLSLPFLYLLRALLLDFRSRPVWWAHSSPLLKATQLPEPVLGREPRSTSSKVHIPVFLAALDSMQGLRSPTRDATCASYSGTRSLNARAAREVPEFMFLMTTSQNSFTECPLWSWCSLKHAVSLSPLHTSLPWGEYSLLGGRLPLKFAASRLEQQQGSKPEGRLGRSEGPPHGPRCSMTVSGREARENLRERWLR